MPEIKIKHVVSFSSEDKVHKAENILKPETYRKWKCANPGEKNASIILQFEKATKINSIDIGNEGSAFVEVLVGRSSDSVKDYQVLLVASSFMSPIESRNESHPNRVRMFGPDKLAHNLKDEKWDCVQVVCTQPFNKNISYGLSFIKFHTAAEKNDRQAEENEAKTTTKLGAFKIKYDEEDDDDSLPSIGSWLERKKNVVNSSLVKGDNASAPSYASSVLASSISPKTQNSTKRKLEDEDNTLKTPRAKKESPATHVNKAKIGYRDITSANDVKSNENQKFGPRDIFGLKTSSPQPPSASNKPSDKIQVSSPRPTKPVVKEKVNSKPKFHELMKGVVFVISGFVNPLRSDIRDKALEMGAKYKGDWDKACTHLICAFVNTPKYLQVRKENGKIVTKDWILDCHKKRSLLPWKKYMLGRYARDSSESSSGEEEIQQPKPPAKRDKIVNGSSKPDDSNSSKADNVNNKRKVDSLDRSQHLNQKDENDSETEDEEALQDYLANTDVEAESGEESEVQIIQKKDKSKEENVFDLIESDEDSSLLSTKPDTTALPLPELPNIFKSKHFFLYGDFSESVHHTLKRIITTYNGILKDYMCDTVKFVISESKWDKNFDDALAENEDLIFVRPEWIWKCHEKEKFVPYQPFIISDLRD